MFLTLTKVGVVKVFKGDLTQQLGDMAACWCEGLLNTCNYVGSLTFSLLGRNTLPVWRLIINFSECVLLLMTSYLPMEVLPWTYVTLNYPQLWPLQNQWHSGVGGGGGPHPGLVMTLYPFKVIIWTHRLPTWGFRKPPIVFVSCTYIL